MANQTAEPIAKLTMYKVAPVNISTAELLDPNDAYLTPQDAMGAYGQQLPIRDSSGRYIDRELQLFEIQVSAKKHRQV